MGNSGAKKSAIKVIVNEAKAYEKKLNNRHFLVVYQEKQETKNVILGFREMNFAFNRCKDKFISATILSCLFGGKTV